MKETVTKVMSFQLHYISGCNSYYDLQACLWNVQKQTQEILNHAIQFLFNYDIRNALYFKETGTSISLLEETGSARSDGYLYRFFRSKYPNIASKNIGSIVQKAWHEYNSARQDILSGRISLPSFKSNQPIIVNRDVMHFSNNENGLPTVQITLFSKEFKKVNGLRSNLVFELNACDQYQAGILDSIISGAYSWGESSITNRKNKWFINLTYIKPKLPNVENNSRILGVDLGEILAICASSKGEKGSFIIEGGEVSAFAAQHEKRTMSIQKQSNNCGEGRIGHGIKTRTKPAYQSGEKVSNFRNTINHRYSKALIDYAVSLGYSTIQMEDLKGIKEAVYNTKALRHWTYEDLQLKIIQKASEKGIGVVFVNPRYTSLRCSKCGYIDAKNRKDQAHFCCIKCGFKANADYNASQNISIKDIDKIIEREYNAGQVKS